MKYFSKLLSMLLVGVVLVSTACTDYADDIANTNEQLEEVQADVEGILELLDKIECEHGDALDAIIAGHCDDLAGLAEDIADANDEILALKGVDADLKKSIEFINTLLKELAGEQDEEKLLSAMATWNALFDGLKVFYETQLEGLLSDVEAAKAFMAAMNETLNSYKATYSQKLGMAAVVEDLETVIAKFQALEKEFAQYKEDTAVEFSKVYAAIASLGSVQSIVYVPEYSDGCATINVAYINNMIVEARSTMEFMVTPASGAGKIVSMWTEDPEVLAIVHEDLKERLNTRSAEHLFNVANVYVKNGEPDRLMVEFDTRHLDPAFYAGEKSYALSLVYNAGNEGDVTSEANVASCFAKAIVTTKPEILNVEIVDAADKFITNTVGEHHDIQYTNAPRKNEKGEAVQEIPVTLLDMHKIAFYAEGFEKEFRTLEEMLAQGYDLNLVNDIKPTDKAGYKMDFSKCIGTVAQDKDPLVASYKYTEGEHDYYQSEIAKEFWSNRNYVGYVGTYKYNYIVESNYYVYDPAVTLDPESNDLTPDVFYAESEVEISPLAVSFSINPVELVWQYEYDKFEDAKGEADARYSRSGDLAFDVPELPKALNEALDAADADAMAYEIIADGKRPDTVIFKIINPDENDVVNADAYASVYHEDPAKCHHDAGDCAYKFEIINFTWENWIDNKTENDYNRDYLIEMLYKTDYLHLSIFVEVNTIDRARAAVSVGYDKFAELYYHSDMKFTFDGNNDLLGKLWDVRTAGDQAKHYTTTSKNEWLKDNFVTNAIEVVSDKINEVAKENSKLVFDIAAATNKYEFNVVYDYAEETGVIAHEQKYAKDINTWYDQEFTLNKTIEFQSPDYAFVGVEDYYIGNANGEKYVQAQPRWFPNEQGVPFDKDLALEQFAIERVNMFGAFDLEKSHGFNIDMPSYTDHALCAGLKVDDYTAQYHATDVVNTPANVTDNKEKDANYRTYDAGLLIMNQADNEDHCLYLDAKGDYHYIYTDVLRPMFEIETEVADYDKPHIEFNTVADYTDYTYALAYYGSTPKVEVGAKLYVVNSNNKSQFEVTGTNFDSDKVNSVGENYSNFYARMHYPFKDLVTREDKREVAIELGSAAKTYYINVAQAFSLKDKRDVELLNEPVDNDKIYPIFVEGNDTNGFATGYSADEVYGYPNRYPDCNHVSSGIEQNGELKIAFTCDGPADLPQDIANAINWDPETAILTFDYKPEMRLLKDIEFVVTARLDCSWTCGYGKDKPVVDLQDVNDNTKEVWATATVKFQERE